MEKFNLAAGFQSENETAIILFFVFSFRLLRTDVLCLFSDSSYLLLDSRNLLD